MTQLKSLHYKQIRWEFQIINCFQELYNPAYARFFRNHLNL